MCVYIVLVCKIFENFKVSVQLESKNKKIVK